MASASAVGVVPMETSQVAVQAAAVAAAVLVVLRAAVAANSRRCPIRYASCSTVVHSSCLYLWYSKHLAMLLCL